jgi:uncharacterized repeat protein (TIGR01451 family)
MRKRTVTSLALGVALLLAVAAPAQAETAWQITSAHGPQNMPPGGVGQYVVQLYNSGDTDSDGSPITVTDTLPPGVSVNSLADIPSDVSNGGLLWDCSATAFPATTVTCSTTGVVRAPGLSIEFRGSAEALLLNVEVDPSPPAGGDNLVTVSGGGAGAEASTSDHTVFSPTAAGFGFVAGSVAGDGFDALFPSGSPVRQAGSHPFELRVGFDLNLRLREDPDAAELFTEPEDRVKTLITRLPLGFIGNPQAVPMCPLGALNSSGVGGKAPDDCSPNSQIGTADLVIQNGKNLSGDQGADIPVYNLEPPPGVVAAFGFTFRGNPILIEAELDPADRYAVLTKVTAVNAFYALRSTRLTLWGVPADPAHDALRVNPKDPTLGDTAMNTASTAPIRPFLTLPTQCDTPAGSFGMVADSWQSPGAFAPEQHGVEIQATGCDDPRFRFEPTIAIQPTSHEAASPTGLDIDLTVPQKDDSFVNGSPEQNAANAAKLYAQSGDDRAIVVPNLEDAVTRLPPGMAVNPSIADGLTGCSQAEVGLDDNEAPACPDSSKIGSVEIDSPMVPDTITGSVYQARQSENPHGSLLGFYTVAQGDGLTIKLAARVDADPETGQLTTTFLDSPQLAFTHYRLHFNGGQRAPLVNPPLCGTHSATAHFTSWNSSVPEVDTGDQMQIASGPNGKPCPSSLAGRPFAPGFDAKTLLPIAGAFSPFALEVSRQDGEQELRTIETVLPPGMLGRLAGVPYCPEAAIASISAAPGTGLGQRLSPNCPAASLVGHTDAAAGAGALPFHNPGSVYLAGPYKGAPLSLAIVTPVVAGPLDLGSIVVRAAIHVDPVTAQIRVLGDPIPEKIVADGNGFPLNLRSVRVSMDRDRFTLNPTSCEPMAVDGTIGSLQGASARVADRFQVGACRALDFKPKLSLSVKGGTKRGAHPKLRAVLKAKPGEANIAKAQVTLPHSEFLAQDHIRTVCTRAQFAAEACPLGSIYGKARAFTPLLDQPLEGPVYLRSSNNPLPDLVVALDGQIEIDLVGRIDSVGGGIRTTFSLVPDAPVSKFVLAMKGGKRSLLENSRNLCNSTNRATVKMDAQNGKTHDTRPVLKDSCGAKAKKGKARSRAKAAG